MNRINESLRILLWSSVVIYVVICSFSITQIDIWWQLAEGAHILDTWHVPTQPVAAFGLPATPYFDEYAGYEVVLATIYKTVGFSGLWLVFIAVYLTIIFLPSRYTRRAEARYDVLSCLALLVAGLLMKDRLEQRPELVGSLLQVILMVLLRRSKLEEITLRKTLPFFIVFLVWTNTHGSFLLGLFTLFIWLGCEIVLKMRSVPLPVLLKKGAMLGAVAGAALIINPYGPERLWFPFLQAFDPGSTALSVEMWPIMDMWGATGIMVMLTLALIAWAVLTTRTTAQWLIIYTIFAACMTFKSFRCVSLLAIALLFVYADRDAQLKPSMPRYPLLIPVRGAMLCLGCLFVLFWDAYNMVLAYNDTKHEPYFATHSIGFAPEIVDSPVFGTDHRLPLLCGLDEGSYVSFRANDHFRPLLDSGMGHFADAAKRYYFFLLHEPEALDLALKDLKVDYVMVNNHTDHWILELGHAPGWKMIACSPNGMLWQRAPGGSYVPSDADRAEIAGARDILLQRGDVRGAFCYSTLIDTPAESLAIFSNYGGAGYIGWPEALYNYLQSWVDTLPPAAIRDFLSSYDVSRNMIMSAVLSSRLGPGDYAKLSQKISPDPQPELWKIAQVEDALARGDRAQARKIFDTISKKQPASVTYYGLWHAVRDGDPGAKQDRLSDYGEWQVWNDSARAFIESTSTQLNARIDELSR